MPEVEKTVEFDEELQQILDETPKQATQELFDVPGVSMPNLKGGTTENPILANNLYHGTIQKLLRKYLPKTNAADENARRVAKG